MLIEKAKHLGIPCAVYRLGTVSGHSNTGHSNEEAFFHKLLCGIVQMQSYPASNSKFQIIPVDIVAQIIPISFHLKYCINKIFHVTNPVPFTVTQLGEMIAAEGYSVKSVPYLSWKNSVLTSNEGKNALVPLHSYFHSGFPSEHLASCSNFLDALKQFTSIQTIPLVSSKLIGTYLIYFKSRNLID